MERDMNARDRVRFYAQETGLTQREVALYRTTPVSGWTTRRERQIGSVIRSLERMLAELGDDLKVWLEASARLLSTVGEFVSGALKTAAAFAEQMAEVIDWLSDWLRKYPTLTTILEGLMDALAGRGVRRALPGR